MFDGEKEIQFLKNEVLELRRNQSSRRGLEGPRGLSVKGDKGDKGDPGTVSKEQAVALFREVVNELYSIDEVAKALARQIPSEVVDKIVRDAWHRHLDRVLAQKN